MFSNITEAWGDLGPNGHTFAQNQNNSINDHDPVKEMTRQLSSGAFDTNTELGEIFDFKNQKKKNSLTKYPTTKYPITKYPVTKNSQQFPKSDDGINLSDINSISLLSDDALLDYNSYFGTYAPADFDQYNNNRSKNNRKHNRGFSNNGMDNKYMISDNTFSDNAFFSDNTFSDFPHSSKCMFSFRHLKTCFHCHDKMKHLIDIKVNKRIDEIILENKIKQLQNIPFSMISQPTLNSRNNNNSKSESYKETLIIVVGALIALIILFIIVKIIHK